MLTLIFLRLITRNSSVLKSGVSFSLRQAGAIVPLFMSDN